MAVILPSIYYSPGLDTLIAVPAKREMNMKTLYYVGKGVILTDKYDRGACVFAVLTEMEAQYASHDRDGNYTQYRLVYSLVECMPPEDEPIIIGHSSDLKEICRMYALQRMTNMWRKELLPSGLKRLEDLDELQKEIYEDAMWSSLEAADEETLQEFLSYADPRNTKPTKAFVGKRALVAKDF